MRDVAIVLVFVWLIPRILRDPFIGSLTWIVFSVLNPHRLTWGFAFSLPFAMVTALLTLVSLLINTKQPRNLPLTPITVTLLLLVLWMNLSTFQAIFPDSAQVQYVKVMKTFFMTFIVLITVRTKEQIHLAVLCTAASVAFYGVKGGIFTILSGGGDRVWGPADSYIQDNNGLALALIMTCPLLWYLQAQEQRRWIKRGIWAGMGLCLVAAIGTYSRGALLAIGATLFMLWLKSKRKVVFAVAFVPVIPIAAVLMPDQWTDRMNTIQTYEQDASALGRINAWWMCYNLAKDRLFGGGFSIYDYETFIRYAPDPNDVHAAHSIYFAALGEHGFVGLFLYLAFGFFCWRAASRVVRLSRGVADLQWAYNLGTMLQVTMVSFAVGGAFLSLLYFDVPYYLAMILVALDALVKRHLEEAQRERRQITKRAKRGIPALQPSARAPGPSP
jgi:probable O-glycosylation ligase (exosortase A-associated)